MAEEFYTTFTYHYCIILLAIWACITKNLRIKQNCTISLCREKKKGKLIQNSLNYCVSINTKLDRYIQNERAFNRQN